MDFENELERVAQQYRDEGYVVVTHPGTDQLPAFAADFGVSLLATRGAERALVQVKRDRSELEADPDVPVRAGITNAHPGWQYDLVILNEGDPLRRMTRDAREPSKEEIDDMLAYVERTIQAGDLRAACVFAWSTLEAAMRHACRDAGLSTPRTTAGELLRTLYGNGVLSRESFDQLNRSFRLRTEIVHGLVPPAVDPDLVWAVVRATRCLLEGKPGARSAAG
jgi:hypothetical protein